jgi:hypothetical protein
MLFDLPTPEWVIVKHVVDWSHARLKMTGSFAQVSNLKYLTQHVHAPQGIRDGLEIAKHLANNADVLSSLRDAAKSTP